MTAVKAAATQYELGDEIEITVKGVIVGASEFLDGGRSYLIETDEGGRKKRQWVGASRMNCGADV